MKTQDGFGSLFFAHSRSIMPSAGRDWERKKFSSGCAAGQQEKECSVFDEELDAFKRLDIREYAATLGYAEDARESWKTCTVMRDGRDKIFCLIDIDGHWIYYSFHEPGNPLKKTANKQGGTILDFIQGRKGLSFGQIRKELRPWLGRPSLPLPRFAPLLPFRSTPDRNRVEHAYRQTAPADRHPYLEQARAIPPALLSSPRFAGRVRIDGRGNAVFPHFDHDGLAGFEIKNTGFTGFASGGTKALWTSHDRPDDRRLVLTESAIDALSYAALFPDDRTRYRSIGGQISPQQPALITAEITQMPLGSAIVCATDNDDAGHQLAAIVENAVQATERSDITFRVHVPASNGADWNDVLRGDHPPSPAVPFSKPPVP